MSDIPHNRPIERMSSISNKKDSSLDFVRIRAEQKEKSLKSFLKMNCELLNKEYDRQIGFLNKNEAYFHENIRISIKNVFDNINGLLEAHRDEIEQIDSLSMGDIKELEDEQKILRKNLEKIRKMMEEHGVRF